MTELLAGKVAIITGAAHPQGIGRAILEAMENHGAKVFGSDLANTPGLADIDGIACDVSIPEQCEALVRDAVERFGRVDILVNNAGVGIGSGDFLEIEAKEWELSLQVNLMGQVNMCQAAIPRMLDEGGSIINVASLSGLGALDSIPACYTASKFASVGFTKQLALQYASSVTGGFKVKTRRTEARPLAVVAVAFAGFEHQPIAIMR